MTNSFAGNRALFIGRSFCIKGSEMSIIKLAKLITVDSEHLKKDRKLFLKMRKQLDHLIHEDSKELKK